MRLQRQYFQQSHNTAGKLMYKYNYVFSLDSAITNVYKYKKIGNQSILT